MQDGTDSSRLALYCQDFGRVWYFLNYECSLQFMPSGQYGLCFGYCFSGPLPLRSHNAQVTFMEPFPGVPSHLDYTQKLARSILALNLSVTTTPMVKYPISQHSQISQGRSIAQVHYNHCRELLFCNTLYFSYIKVPSKFPIYIVIELGFICEILS